MLKLTLTTIDCSQVPISPAFRWIGLLVFLLSGCASDASENGSMDSPTGGPTGRRRVIEGVEFVELGPGQFTMGTELEGSDSDCWDNERPAHSVTIGYSFWISTTEVTVGQIARFDSAVAEWAGISLHLQRHQAGSDSAAALSVYWKFATEYCAWLEQRTGLPMRLPTEAEWEYACRAGTRTRYSFGERETDLAQYGIHIENHNRYPHGVARLRPNEWGLYDTHGGSWEWCLDTEHSDYVGAPADGSAWIDEMSPWRMKRGGAMSSDASRCTSASRVGCGTARAGFRLVFVENAVGGAALTRAMRETGWRP